MANYPTFLPPFITTIILLLSIPSHQITLQTPTISAAPAVLPDPPASPYTELSPDIAPLLPSPGGAAKTPAGSSMPTIPSSRSTNPDTMDSVGPDTAAAPSGSLMDSSAGLVKGGDKGGAFSAGFLAFWLVVLFIM